MTRFLLCLLLPICGWAATNLPPGLARLNQSPYFQAIATESGGLHVLVALPLKPTERGARCTAGAAWCRTAGGQEFFMLQLFAQGTRADDLPGLQNYLAVGGRDWSVKLTEPKVEKPVLSYREIVTAVIDRKTLNRIANEDGCSVFFNSDAGDSSLVFSDTARSRLRVFLAAIH